MWKQFRLQLALGVRLIGFIWSLPSILMYALSDFIKNKEDKFNF